MRSLFLKSLTATIQMKDILKLKKYTERLILTAVKETKTQKTKYVKQKNVRNKKIARYFGLQNKPSSGATKVECFTDPGLLKIRQLSTPCRCGLSSL